MKTIPTLTALMLLGTTACASGPDSRTTEPIRLIVETDMGNDIDDALAFDLIYKAMDEGRIDLLAIGNHKLSPTATDYIDILNTWYGYPDIPLARSTTPVRNEEAPDYTAAVCAMTDSTGAPAFARSKRPQQIEQPVVLYRRILAAQSDHSVTVLSLGFATELAKLLDSPADSLSPLTGRELVARKVRLLSIMAGSYGEKQRAEYNVVNDTAAMRKLFAEWETPIVQNPFELGKRIMYPGSAIENDFSWAPLHPVVEGYRNYHTMPYDRATWDLLSVVWLLRPDLFTPSQKGRIAVDERGFTRFTPDPHGNARYLTVNDEQAVQLREYIIRTTTRAPKRYQNRY